MAKYPSKERTQPQMLRRKWYASKLWQRIRLAQLARQPRCALCGDEARVVDHVDGHGEEIIWEKSFSDNYLQEILRQKFFTGRLQSVCHPCHNRKRFKERELLNSPTGFVPKRDTEAQQRVSGGNTSVFDPPTSGRGSAGKTREVSFGQGDKPPKTRSEYLNRLLGAKP